jgi:hypothetical protein
MDRAADELRSWFGDERAERRRRGDERHPEPWRERESGGPRGEERSWARNWGYIEGRGEPRRGWGERSENSWTGRTWGEQGGGERDWRERSGSRDWPRYTDPAWDAPAYGRTPEGERSWEERRGDVTPWVSYVAIAWRGPHAGLGPRNYQRSDERIREEVCERLAQNGEVDASDVEVTVASGEVTLAGRVNSRGERRIAEDLVESVWGVREIHNQIRVGQAESGRPGEGPDATGQGWRARVA